MHACMPAHVCNESASSGDLARCSWTKMEKKKLVCKRSIPPSNSSRIAKKPFKDYPVSGEVCLLSCQAYANLLQDVESMGL